jgi:sterol 14-demethylase
VDFDDMEKNLEEGKVMSGSASLRNVGEERRWKNTLVADSKDHIPVPPPQQPVSGSTPRPSLTSKTESSSKGERSTHSISQTLKRIPLEAWEHSTPIMDALIKETLRVAQPHTAMRRNVGPEFYIDGKLVPTGTYVVYPFSDVHLDEEIYEDAWKFDPGRWLNGDETEMKGEKGVPFGYIGWGAGTCLSFAVSNELNILIILSSDAFDLGKHVCLGTRLAKVELKLIVSMFLLGFDLDIVDKRGKPQENLPKPNWNDIILCRPPKDSFYLGFERKGGALL